MQFNSKYLVTLVVKWIDHDRSKYQIKKRNVDTKSATLSQYQDIEVAKTCLKMVKIKKDKRYNHLGHFIVDL